MLFLLIGGIVEPLRNNHHEFQQKSHIINKIYFNQININVDYTMTKLTHYRIYTNRITTIQLKKMTFAERKKRKKKKVLHKIVDRFSLGN